MMDERNNDNMNNEQGYYNQPEQNNGNSYTPPNNTSYGGTYGQYSYNPYGRTNPNNMNNGYRQPNPQQEYNWNFEDYEANGRRNVKRRKSNTGLIVIGTLLAVIFFVGVVCLAGYGIYTMLETTDSEEYSESSSI
ncbi:MAG: hypothetical protein J5968_04080, partial [Oscillospiraceae bacterium]|nr:hypothetical protein [Oscillospiraceae bacterium]